MFTCMSKTVHESKYVYMHGKSTFTYKYKKSECVHKQLITWTINNRTIWKITTIRRQLNTVMRIATNVLLPPILSNAFLISDWTLTLIKYWKIKITAPRRHHTQYIACFSRSSSRKKKTCGIVYAIVADDGLSKSSCESIVKCQNASCSNTNKYFCCTIGAGVCFCDSGD